MRKLARRLVALGLVSLVVTVAARLAVGHPIVALRLVLSDAPDRLPVPVQGVRARDVRDSWGAPRSGGRSHRGIDIFAPRGTPIVSATDGIVLKVGTSHLGGRVAWILGPGGRLHYHAHLESYGPQRRGDVVEAGEVIGFVGDSGNARGTPCHLHYGVYSASGAAMNPYPLLAPPARSTSRVPKA